MTTALAMFGNSSTFFIATTATDLTTGDNYKRICQDTVLPFSLYTSRSITLDDICSTDRSSRPTDFDPKFPPDVETDETLLPEFVYNFIILSILFLTPIRRRNCFGSDYFLQARFTSLQPPVSAAHSILGLFILVTDPKYSNHDIALLESLWSLY